MEVLFDPAPMAATIVGVHADKDRVNPGDQVEIKVDLRMFRAPDRTVSFTVAVPKDAAAGKIILTVRGGYSEPRTGDQDKADNAAQFLPGAQAASLTELLADFTGRSANNELILEYMPLSHAEEGDGTPVVIKRECDFIVKGEKQLFLDVQTVDAANGGN
jgi:hypothetical protein